MKSIILYGSPTKLTNAHKPVHTVGNPNPPNGGKAQPAYYVRMEVVNFHFEEALDKAKPTPGEIVLNTVPIGKQL